MKAEKILLVLFVIFSLFSCKEDNTINVYSEEDLDKNRGKKIRIIDTLCINQKKKAIEDIKKGKVYTNISEINFTKSYIIDIEYKKIETLLLKKGIQIDTTFFPDCFGRPEGFKKYCYQDIMRKEILKKYGSKLIDSLKSIVEKEYVLNHVDNIYDMHDCDRNSIYQDKRKFKDFFDETKNDFIKSFIYPQGYKYKNENNYSYTDIDFILTKNGKISNLKVESTFQNPENQKHKSYFENFVKKFITGRKWTPAKSSGIVVNGNFRTVFFHK